MEVKLSHSDIYGLSLPAPLSLSLYPQHSTHAEKQQATKRAATASGYSPLGGDAVH